MIKTGARTTSFVGFLLISVLTIQTNSFALDRSKYIGIDEIRPDMKAYCLSVFSGTDVEKFNLDVLSVVRGFQTGHDMILVVGTDERFQHSTVVRGCSGSPVFIDGRLAGALAAGWPGSLDSLYLVRPIERMLEVGTVESPVSVNDGVACGFDFSQPLNIDAYYEQSIGRLQNSSDTSRMLLPLSSSLPAQVLQEHGETLRGMGFLPVAEAGLLPSRSFEEVGEYERGGVLSLVLCGGDISLAATGTVTEVIGDQIFGFGHAFNGQGAVNFPIATGKVHTVVANRNSSFKFSSPGPISGTLLFDQSSAVRGTIGQMPETIPLRIQVKRYNDPQNREYNCYLAVDRTITPSILRMVVDGAANMQGPLPEEHTLRYSAKIVMEGGESFEIDNVTSGRQTLEIGRELHTVVSLLLGNPFKRVNINSIDIKMDAEPVDTTASIWNVDLDQTQVHPGQTVTASVLLRSYRSQEETVTIDLTIPETLKPGMYKMQILGSAGYQSFLSEMAPQKFRSVDLTSLKKALRKLTNSPRDRLYAVMQTPASGVVIRQHELGQLPPTRMLLMQDSKRLQPLENYKAWIENNTELDAIVQGNAEIIITVKQ